MGVVIFLIKDDVGYVFSSNEGVVGLVSRTLPLMCLFLVSCHVCVMTGRRGMVFSHIFLLPQASDCIQGIGGGVLRGMPSEHVLSCWVKLV